MVGATLEIPKVGDDGDAYMLAMAQFNNEIPGFQDFRAVNVGLAQRIAVVNSLLDDVERATEDTFDQQLPFLGPVTSTLPGRYPPHLDGRQSGASLHINQNDVPGTVYLAHPEGVLPHYAYWGHSFMTYDDSGRNYNGKSLAEMPEIVAGVIYEGPLVLNGITVFSQGNIGNLIPAVHQFWREQEGEFLSLEGAGLRAIYESEDMYSAENIAKTAFEFRATLPDLMNTA